MSETNLTEIAAILLRDAARDGATAADVVVVEGDSLSVGVRLGEVEKVERSRSRHLGLRVFVGERSAITSTADFSPGSLAELAADSVALARVTAPDPFGGLPTSDELCTRPLELDLFDPSIAAITPEQATEWCREAEQAARDADPRITNSEGAEFGAGTGRVAYAATNGFAGSYETSSCSLSAVPIASLNGAMERDYWYSSQRHLAKLESPGSIGRKATARAVRRLGARKVSTCEVPVIFDPDMAASLLGHLIGAISGGSLYRGTSFLIGKLGEEIFPDFIQIEDDATRVGGLASKPFDAEGVRTRRVPIIEGGVLRNYLFDTYSAKKLGMKTTGSAARSVADAPFPSSSNFFLHPGTTSPEEIIRSVKSGLYVTELMGFGVNAVTGDYSRGATGLWIENGEISYPVSEITIAGNLLEMFRSIEVVGNDLEMRRSTASPTLKLSRLTIAGE